MAVTREAMLESWEQPTLWQRLTMWDVLWALLVVGGSGYAWWFYQAQMDGYEVAILFGSALALIAWGWYWKPAQMFALIVALLTLLALWRYGTDYGPGKSAFLV